MKKINLKIIIFFISFITYNNLCSQIGVFKVQGKRTQIAYNSNTYSGEYMSFGKGGNSPFNGEWGMEYWNGGFNFWKPSPSFNAGNYKLFISDIGNVGINMKPIDRHTLSIPYSCGFLGWSTCWRTVGNFRLQIEGNAISHGWYTWSDVAIKSNVTNVSGALAKIMALRPVEYNYNQGAINLWRDSTAKNDSSELKQATIDAEATRTIADGEPKHIGLIAQEVAQVVPNIVSPIANSQAVNYVELIPLLIKSTQEQQAIIDSLNLQIQQLRQEIVNWQGRSIDTIGQSKSRLFQNNPNPFDGNTTITYFIDEATTVTSATIEVRNIMGTLQSTITLNDGTGLGNVQYNGSNLTPGYYIYTLKINSSVKDSKMFLKEN
jgi:hypothetical protein